MRTRWLIPSVLVVMLVGTLLSAVPAFAQPALAFGAGPVIVYQNARPYSYPSQCAPNYCSYYTPRYYSYTPGCQTCGISGYSYATPGYYYYVVPGYGYVPTPNNRYYDQVYGYPYMPR